MIKVTHNHPQYSQFQLNSIEFYKKISLKFLIISPDCKIFIKHKRKLCHFLPKLFKQSRHRYKAIRITEKKSLLTQYLSILTNSIDCDHDVLNNENLKNELPPAIIIHRFEIHFVPDFFSYIHNFLIKFFSYISQEKESQQKKKERLFLWPFLLPTFFSSSLLSTQACIDYSRGRIYCTDSIKNNSKGDWDHKK